MGSPATMKAKLLRLKALAHTSFELTGDAGGGAGGSPLIGKASHDPHCRRGCSASAIARRGARSRPLVAALGLRWSERKSDPIRPCRIVNATDPLLAPRELTTLSSKGVSSRSFRFPTIGSALLPQSLRGNDMGATVAAATAQCSPNTLPLQWRRSQHRPCPCRHRQRLAMPSQDRLKLSCADLCTLRRSVPQGEALGKAVVQTKLL